MSSPRLRGLIWAWFYAVTSISAIEKRFRNVAKGNISRLRDAQAFHAAVKRPPYFMFARQRRHFTAGHNVSGMPSPRLRGPFLGLVLCRKSISAMTARFRNVAKGNISRLRDAQAFHAFAKRQTYFTFARQRRHFTAGHSVSGMPSPRLRGRFWDLVLIGVGKGQFKNCSCERWRLFISGCVCTVKSFCF